MEVSMEEDAGSTPADQNYQHTLLYVVQKCWHSGPIQHVPVDMLRLFPTQREAEEAAYHSAQAFAEAGGSKSGDGSVKTLLLPSYPAHNPQGSSYGFLARGGLFWVRALKATIVTAGAGSASCASEAYAILTEGVIGGTGNRNSRRGTEACDGRVFGGDATAAAIAGQARERVREGLTNPSLRVTCQRLPVGKPPSWLRTKAFGGDWPAAAGLGTEPAPVPFGTTPKRKDEASAHHGWGTSAAFVKDSEPLPVVACPFEEPLAKRRRFVAVVDDSAMMQ